MDAILGHAILGFMDVGRYMTHVVFSLQTVTTWFFHSGIA